MAPRCAVRDSSAWSLHYSYISKLLHSTQDIKTNHSVWSSLSKSTELLFPLATRENSFFSTTCLLVSDLHHEEEWSSTNPHPNSQTFLNLKQESQACDKKHYSCPHLLFNIPAPQLFSYPLVLFPKWFQSELMTFIIIYYVHKFQRYDPLVLHLSES